MCGGTGRNICSQQRCPPERLMSSTNPLLPHARGYAQRFKWAIIPVAGKSADGLCKWRRYQLTPPNRNQLGGLFSIEGVTGLAVVLGEVSGGLRVRDYDDEGA